MIIESVIPIRGMISPRYKGYLFLLNSRMPIAA